MKLEKFSFFKNKLDADSLIKKAESKINKGWLSGVEVKLRISYFDGLPINKSIAVESTDGTISFRKHDEEYQLKYFPNRPNENILVFDIKKEIFEKYWNICIDKGIHPEERTLIQSETKSRIGKTYKK